MWIIFSIYISEICLYNICLLIFIYLYLFIFIYSYRHKTDVLQDKMLNGNGNGYLQYLQFRSHCILVYCMNWKKCKEITIKITIDNF